MPAAPSPATLPQAALVQAVDRAMARFIESRPLPANLREAIRYSLLSGGKRLRPILTFRSCEAVGIPAEQAIQVAAAPAAAIEMIHCFSLIHDDLPAMDDDDLRRGRPTLHRHTSEAMAILAGDALTGLAFELIARELQPAELAARITLELAAATNDMIAGQVYDTLPDFDPQTPKIERLRTIHHHKTGALILAACRMGAMCGGADEARLEAISAYARAIGLMFQVVDDLLDVTQTSEALGKAAGKDQQQGKLTYPGVLGIEESRDQVERLRREASNALECLGVAAGPLRELCDYMAVRTK